ncbi:hypothetical protein [Methanocaldococcus sp.]
MDMANVLGDAIYLYVGFLLVILGLAPIYLIFFKLPKLEVRKIREEVISQYYDNLKNIMPSVFNQLLILFLIIGIIIGLFLYFLTKSFLMLISPIACMFFVLYVAGIKKYPVYIYKNGFYFNGIYTWRGFSGYAKIGDKIRLIGKRGITVDMYLRDVDGKVERILKESLKIKNDKKMRNIC